MKHELIELEPSRGVKATHDVRPRVPEPLPVWLVSVADVTLPGGTGQEVDLDRFYIGLLGCRRDFSAAEGILVYHADNHAVRLNLQEMPIEHETLAPTALEVPSLLVLSHRFNDAQVDYQRTRGLTHGSEFFILQDPAGNWLTISERTIVI
jgi:hypothetical protein